MAGAKDCNCGKKPMPLGRPAPTPPPPAKSLVASMGGSGKITYVAPNGSRETVPDLLAGRAAIIRGGGSLDFA